MHELPPVRNAFQSKITVPRDRRADHTVPCILRDKPADHPLFPKKEFHPVRRVVHCIRQKTVKSPELLKPPDVVEQGDDPRQLFILLRESQTPCDRRTLLHDAICMYDLQPYFVILPVIAVQIFFENLLCTVKIHVFSSSCPRTFPLFLILLHLLPGIHH